MTPRLIPGLPDDVALNVLAKLPRALHGMLRAVCCSWRDALHTQGAVVALRKRLRITDSWLAIVSPRFGLLHVVFFDPIHGAFMTSVSQLHLEDAGSCPGCSVCRRYQSPVAVGHKIFFPSISSLAFKTLRCFDAETMQWGKDLQLTTLGHPKLCGGERFSSLLGHPKLCSGERFSSLRRLFSAASGSCFFAASAEANERAFYVSGGNSPNGFGLQGASRVDIETGIWEALPELHNEHWGASAVTLHRRFCVLGGFGPDIRGDWVQSGEAWDPINKRWMLTAEPWPVRPLGTRRQLIAVLKDKLYTVELDCLKPHVQELFYYAEATKLWISMGSFCISALLSEAFSGWFDVPDIKMAATAEELLLVCHGAGQEHKRVFVLSTNPTNLSKPITWKVSVLPLPDACVGAVFHALTVHVT